MSARCNCGIKCSCKEEINDYLSNLEYVEYGMIPDLKDK